MPEKTVTKVAKTVTKAPPAKKATPAKKTLDAYQSLVENIGEGSYPFEEEIFEEIRKEAIRIPETKNRNLIILCGPSGSGKSSVKANVLATIGIPNAITIDTDEIRRLLMNMPWDTIGILVNPVPYDPVLIKKHTAYSKLANLYNRRMLQRAAAAGYNIVYDTVCREFGGVNRLIELARENIYVTHLAMVYASEDTCKQRIVSRNASIALRPPNRIPLDVHVAASIWEDFNSRVAASILKYDYNKLDKVLLYNNDGPNPELLYYKRKRSDGSVTVEITVETFQFYNVRIQRAAPNIVLPDRGGSNRRSSKKHKRIRTKRRKSLRKTKRH